MIKKDDDNLEDAARKYWVMLLEFTTVEDRNIIANTVNRKAKLACEYLQFPDVPATKFLYNHIWSEEVTDQWCALKKGYKGPTRWVKLSDGFRAPFYRSDKQLRSEVASEFRELYQERLKRGIIR